MNSHDYFRNDEMVCISVLISYWHTWTFTSLICWKALKWITIDCGSDKVIIYSNRTDVNRLQFHDRCPFQRFQTKLFSKYVKALKISICEWSVAIFTLILFVYEIYWDCRRIVSFVVIPSFFFYNSQWCLFSDEEFFSL